MNTCWKTVGTVFRTIQENHSPDTNHSHEGQPNGMMNSINNGLLTVSPRYSVIKSSQIYTSTWGAGLKGRFGIGATSSFLVWPWNLGPPTFLWRDHKCRPLVSESKPFCHTCTNMSLILHWASARPSGESIDPCSITLLAIYNEFTESLQTTQFDLLLCQQHKHWHQSHIMSLFTLTLSGRSIKIHILDTLFHKKILNKKST